MTSPITIRTAGPQDISALDRLFPRSDARLLAADYPPSVLVTAIPVIARAQPQLLGSGLFFLAEQGGAILAAGGWSLNPPGGRPGQRGVGHVRHVATNPDHVRKGAGRAVLEHIVLVAKASGMAALHCQSTRTALPFYAAMGFVPRGEITVPLPGGLAFPAIHMERVL